LAQREPHARLAERLLDEDRVFAAFHHAALAREGGADLESFFLTELDALCRLGLRKEAASFQEWYVSQGGRKPRRVALYAARRQIEAGQPEAALRACAPFLDDPELAARAWLEQGRALVALRRPGEAVAAFDRSLALRPGASETLLGKGIALRTLYWEPGNPEGLRAAAACFEEVRERGDFSVPEATHHLATIHLAFEEWARVEELSREAHRLRQSPVSRRNLCLSLHAQGRIEEAFQEYQFLAQHDPVQAAPLQKYFAQ
jgi:tetratricopeptide (TPR) repeat protein